MPSAAQIRANRANAQQSTGPRTASGKLNSSPSAKTRNLTSYSPT